MNDQQLDAFYRNLVHDYNTVNPLTKALGALSQRTQTHTSKYLWWDYSDNEFAGGVISFDKKCLVCGGVFRAGVAIGESLGRHGYQHLKDHNLLALI